MRLIPLGGLGEVGRNMMLIEYHEEILIVDIGFRMPEEDMPGIDYIIPNISYLKGKEKKIMGILATHGHYDHIGAIPYFISKLGNPPIYAGGMAKAIILRRQEDFSNQPKLRIIDVKDGSRFSMGSFSVEAFRQNHNIPDNFGYVIKTPIGNIVHTSDFKFDSAPVNDLPTDFKRLKSIGDEGVLLLMTDSTNAEEPGHSLSEKKIMENLDDLFKNAKGRVITATFASLLNRIQQIITLSEKYGRKVSPEGFSMKTNIEISKQLGYLKARKGTILSTREVLKYPDSKITILATGAQGEERAVLMRIINREHPLLRIQKGDTVIFSSSIIPGNERTVQYVKDNLYRQGANVYNYKMMDIHASGHANQDELKELISLMKPKFLLPVHGQFSMLVNHARLALETGIPHKNIAVIENGQVLNVSHAGISIDKKTVPANYIMVDGLGVGDVGNVVLRDRQVLAEEGVVIAVVQVSSSDISKTENVDLISRGFVFAKENNTLLSKASEMVKTALAKRSGKLESSHQVRDVVSNVLEPYFFTATGRRPMILPVVVEV